MNKMFVFDSNDEECVPLPRVSFKPHGDVEDEEAQEEQGIRIAKHLEANPTIFKKKEPT
jgi:hypothetical protein